MLALIFITGLFFQHGFIPHSPKPNNRIPFPAARELQHWHLLCYLVDYRVSKDGKVFISLPEVLKHDKEPYGKCGAAALGHTWNDVLRESNAKLPNLPDISDVPINYRATDITDQDSPTYCDDETPEGFWGRATPGHLIRYDISIAIHKTPEEEALAVPKER